MIHSRVLGSVRSQIEDGARRAGLPFWYDRFRATFCEIWKRGEDSMRSVLSISSFGGGALNWWDVELQRHP